MTVIGCTGHQNIPPAAHNYIGRAIRDVLDEHSPGLVGTCSLAAGADQLFAQAVLAAGGRLHVVIPCRGYEETFDELDFKQFHAILAQTTELETLDYPEPSEDAYLAGGCRVVDLSDVVLAIWDGQQSRGRGGTADVVEYARQHGKSVMVIWPAGMAR